MASRTSIPEVPQLSRGSSSDSLTTISSSDESWKHNAPSSRTSFAYAPNWKIGSPTTKGGQFEHIDESVDPLEGTRPPIVKNVCFVGAGFVGGPTAALIALHNPNMTVNVVDLNEERIAAWNSTHLPIHEAGLPKVVRIARDGTRQVTVPSPKSGESITLPARQPNLFFTSDVTKCLPEADIIFICVNTPTKMHGVGAGATADLFALESATRTVAKHAKVGAIIVEKSTVPCRTSKMLGEILQQIRPETNFEILSNPEFLAEGTAVDDLMHPDRILIGSAKTPEGLRAASALKSVYGAWVPLQRIVTVNTFSSELTKLIANAMLAQRISSINAVSALCEELEADVSEVSRALGLDTRLGRKFLQAGVGFGGSCFEKDILNLSYLARCLHLPEVADYWMSILSINAYQRQRFAQQVVRKLHNNLRGKKIAIYGFAFKDGTNDTRNSIAVHIIADLAAELPREIAIFDPGCNPDEVREEIERVIPSPALRSRIKVCADWREPVDGASAVCILTPWHHFKGRHGRRPSRIDRDILTTTTIGAVQNSNHDGALSEMDIMDLEKIQSGMGQSQVEDLLQRLGPAPQCPPECQACKKSSVSHTPEDIVNWMAVSQMMERPAWVFDGRNIVDGVRLQQLGFKVHITGKGAGL
ncbi:UDP-glucose 6-dehydrogenase [Pleurostoma richardsiae]|uniref:UDP-glucose 6-dehydrogenase n=1 Tax=Pleurostoma richardsiae TaxID=41990 RepID=A0AA38RWE9_9PEZI|nr:UDP-glucose 6-dehydrogenase [Pleurostoma richardsiae]